MTAVHGLGDEAPARRHLAHLLGADGQHQVVFAGGDGERRVAHGLDAGGAVGRHPRHGNGEEVQRVGHERARVALEPIQHRLVATEPRGLQPRALDLRIGQGQRHRLVHHVGETLMEVFTELDDTAADDRDLPAQSHGSSLSLPA